MNPTAWYCLYLGLVVGVTIGLILFAALSQSRPTDQRRGELSDKLREAGL